MTGEVKPCPFCGDDPLIEVREERDYPAVAGHIECHGCGANMRGPVIRYKRSGGNADPARPVAHARVLKRWNRRA